MKSPVKAKTVNSNNTPPKTQKSTNMSKNVPKLHMDTHTNHE